MPSSPRPTQNSRKVTNVLFRSDDTIAGFEDKGDYNDRLELRG
jgi:hypothetical protein